MSYDLNPRRRLSMDVDISTMLSMRQKGMTNKQIATSLDISPTTVYRYIGKMSTAVKVAEMHGKPVSSVIPESKVQPTPTLVPDKKPQIIETKKPEPEKVEPVTPKETAEPKPVEMPETPAVEEPKKLRVISSRLTLQGNLCKYVVDTDADSIEIDGGVLNGLLDKTNLFALIDELNEIKHMFER